MVLFPPSSWVLYRLSYPLCYFSLSPSTPLCVCLLLYHTVLRYSKSCLPRRPEQSAMPEEEEEEEGGTLRHLPRRFYDFFQQASFNTNITIKGEEKSSVSVCDGWRRRRKMIRPDETAAAINKKRFFSRFYFFSNFWPVIVRPLKPIRGKGMSPVKRKTKIKKIQKKKFFFYLGKWTCDGETII